MRVLLIITLLSAGLLFTGCEIREQPPERAKRLCEEAGGIYMPGWSSHCEFPPE